MFALQAVAMLPLARRMLVPQQSQERPTREFALSAWQPGIVLHTLGLLLVWVGFGIRFWTVGIERTVTWQGLLGSFLLVLATVLMFASFAVLTSWRLLPVIGSDHRFCDIGVYRLVRHPIYVAFDLIGIGVAVAVSATSCERRTWTTGVCHGNDVTVSLA